MVKCWKSNLDEGVAVGGIYESEDTHLAIPSWCNCLYRHHTVDLIWRTLAGFFNIIQASEFRRVADDPRQHFRPDVRGVHGGGGADAAHPEEVRVDAVHRIAPWKAVVDDHFGSSWKIWTSNVKYLRGVIPHLRNSYENEWLHRSDLRIFDIPYNKIVRKVWYAQWRNHGGGGGGGGGWREIKPPWPKNGGPTIFPDTKSFLLGGGGGVGVHT